MKTGVLELSIILPAYEEAENLQRLLPVLQKVAGELEPSHEILVVDTTKPRDRSPEICRSHCVTYLPREGGECYGHAIRTGIAACRGKWVVLMDADGSHNPAFIRELWKKRGAADLIIASRYVSGGRTENPPILIFLSWVVNVVFRFVLDLRCWDVSNSFRLYRGDDLRRLQLQCRHFDIVEEILILLCGIHPGYRLLEIPATFEERKAGKTKRQLFIFALGYLAVLWRLWFLRRKALRRKNG